MSTTTARSVFRRNRMSVSKKYRLLIFASGRCCDQPRVNGGVPVGGIEHAPVSRRQLGEDRKHGVSENADPRHARDIAQVVEPVALRVVGLAGDDRRDEIAQQPRIHLSVTVDFHDHRCAIVDRGAIARHHGAPDTLVRRMPEDADSLVAAIRRDEVPRALGAGVVDDVDARAFRPDGGDHAGDVPGDAEARNDDGNARPRRLDDPGR